MKTEAEFQASLDAILARGAERLAALPDPRCAWNPWATERRPAPTVEWFEQCPRAENYWLNHDRGYADLRCDTTALFWRFSRDLGAPDIRVYLEALVYADDPLSLVPHGTAYPACLPGEGACAC